MEKNIYGLSEGVLKACEFLGLKLPVPLDGEHVPSDYFGDDFKFDDATIKKLRTVRKWSDENFKREYDKFSKKFAMQKPLKQTKTDLNVYFCDHVLFDGKQGASFENYFDFEFYNKSFALRDGFITQKYMSDVTAICNDSYTRALIRDKCQTNKLFADFIRRDWLDTRKCTFEDFKTFVEKHSRFFAKPISANGGRGAEIISVDTKANLGEIFAELKNKKRLLEEIIIQHENLRAFCPDTLNTIRICTVLDIHNVVHFLVTCGRFGRVGNVVDNFHGGGLSVVIDPETGIIISDAINQVHERVSKHPDTGKVFRGFQYPAWEKIRAIVKTMAKMIPQLRCIGWDIAVNENGEALVVEANVGRPGEDIQQAADSVGRRYLYEPLIAELKNYEKAQIQLMGWRVNNLRNFDYAYNTVSRNNARLKFAMSKLIPDCKSLMDLGCRKEKSAKALCPEGVNYFPVDYKKHDDEVILWAFNDDKIITPPPRQIAVDACLCAFTAEFVEHLSQFFDSMCNVTRKQILMLCRPADREINAEYRKRNSFLTDFTEEFLIKTMAQNHFQLKALEFVPGNRSLVIYDFRRI